MDNFNEKSIRTLESLIALIRKGDRTVMDFEENLHGKMTVIRIVTLKEEEKKE